MPPDTGTWAEFFSHYLFRTLNGAFFLKSSVCFMPSQTTVEGGIVLPVGAV
jgi:hypothetical protein